MRKISVGWALGVLAAVSLFMSGQTMAQASSSSSSSARSSSGPAQLPPLPSGFVVCASKGEICSFTGTRTVLTDSCFEYTCWSSRVVATESLECRAHLYSGFARCAYSAAPLAPLEGLVATASTKSSNNRAAAKAFDGLADTRWEASNSSSGSWLQIKRTTPFRLLKVELSEYGNRIRGYRLEYLDGSVWIPIQEGATLGSLALPINPNLFIVTKAVRIVTTGVANGQPSISEFRVLGEP